MKASRRPTDNPTGSVRFESGSAMQREPLVAGPRNPEIRLRARAARGQDVGQETVTAGDHQARARKRLPRSPNVCFACGQCGFETETDTDDFETSAAGSPSTYAG